MEEMITQYENRTFLKEEALLKKIKILRGVYLQLDRQRKALPPLDLFCVDLCLDEHQYVWISMD
jgi:hypothetical protein